MKANDGCGAPTRIVKIRKLKEGDAEQEECVQARDELSCIADYGGNGAAPPEVVARFEFGSIQMGKKRR